MTLDPDTIDAALNAAQAAASGAHCPYSRFPVGAAALDRTGRTWTGANVENASFPAGCCAEQVALNYAVSHGVPLDGFALIAVWTDTRTPTSPCGVCRQVMSELAPSARVVSLCASGARLDTSVAELLPASFDASALPGHGEQDG